MRKNFGAKPFFYPQPVMILGTYDENGKANAMNAAWGGIVVANEIIVDLSAHKTTDNIIINKAFTVGVADLEHLVACDYVGIVSANKETNKVKKAGFTTTKSEFVNAPIINELPLTLECELVKVIDGSKYLAEIKNVSQMRNISVMTEKLILVSLHRLHMTRYITDIIDLENMWEMLLRMEHS